MTAVNFTLPCVPTAQARPRHMRTRTGRDLTYKSATQEANERTLEVLLARYVPDKPIEGGIELQFTAVMPIPSTASKKTQNGHAGGQNRPYGEARHGQPLQAAQRLHDASALLA